MTFICSNAVHTKGKVSTKYLKSASMWSKGKFYILTYCIRFWLHIISGLLSFRPMMLWQLVPLNPGLCGRNWESAPGLHCWWQAAWTPNLWQLHTKCAREQDNKHPQRHGARKKPRTPKRKRCGSRKTSGSRTSSWRSFPRWTCLCRTSKACQRTKALPPFSLKRWRSCNSRIIWLSRWTSGRAMMAMSYNSGRMATPNPEKTCFNLRKWKTVAMQCILRIHGYSFGFCGCFYRNSNALDYCMQVSTKKELFLVDKNEEMHGGCHPSKANPA